MNPWEQAPPPSDVLTPTPAVAGPVPAKRRQVKSEKERYLEAARRAQSLKERLEARRSQNRDQVIELLYRKLNVSAVEGDFDESERIALLRERLNQVFTRPSA